MIRIIPSMVNRFEREWLIDQARGGSSQMETYEGGNQSNLPVVTQLSMNPMIARIANLLVGQAQLVKNAHVLRYAPGQYMEAHADNGVWSTDGEWVVRHFFSASAIIYLNECDGGETVFKNQGLSITPIPGLCVFAPCGGEYLHEVKPAKTERFSLIIRFGEHL